MMRKQIQDALFLNQLPSSVLGQLLHVLKCPESSEMAVNKEVVRDWAKMFHLLSRHLLYKMYLNTSL